MNRRSLRRLGPDRSSPSHLRGARPAGSSAETRLSRLDPQRADELSTAARSQSKMPEHHPRTIELAFDGPVERCNVMALCDRFRVLLEGSDAVVAVCDLAPLGGADLALLDVLARLHVIGKRLGLEIRILNAPARLQDLVSLAGLSGVIDVQPAPRRRDGAADRRAGTSSRCRGRT